MKNKSGVVIALLMVTLGILFCIALIEPFNPPKPTITPTVTKVIPTRTPTATKPSPTYTPTYTLAPTKVIPTKTKAPTFTPTNTVFPTPTFTPEPTVRSNVWWNCYFQINVDYPRYGWHPCKAEHKELINQEKKRLYPDDK